MPIQTLGYQLIFNNITNGIKQKFNNIFDKIFV
jgi:hypothetical protein